MAYVVALNKLGAMIGHDFDSLVASKGEIVKRTRLLVKTRGIAMAHEEVRRANPPPFDTGRYNLSFKAEDIEDGVALLNVAPYAAVIEEGRRPGARQPPREVLIPWIQRKMGKSAEEAAALAFIIARAIARKGITPKNIVRKTAERLIPHVVDLINAVLKGPLPPPVT